VTVADAAWQAALHRLPGIPKRPGMCLALARVIIEHANGWKSHELYVRHLTHGNTRRPGDETERLAAARLDPHAADLEASLKRQGLGVPWAARQAGDLAFNINAAAPFGHVAVLVGRDLCVENIDPRYRKDSLDTGQYVHLTRLQDRPWTLIARLP
jgi:hypothetical protein